MAAQAVRTGGDQAEAKIKKTAPGDAGTALKKSILIRRSLAKPNRLTFASLRRPMPGRRLWRPAMGIARRAQSQKVFFTGTD
jgi:hypothetical protein